MEITHILEALMLLSFGFAWPFSIRKSFKSKSTKGKSLMFLIVLLAGYVCGVANKLIQRDFYILFFYLLNFVMVFIDLILYIRNKRDENMKKCGAAERRELR